MGQQASTSNCNENFIPQTIKTIHYECATHIKTITEISTITYEDFQKSLTALNELSKNCIDSNGNQLIFAIKKGSDSSLLWKATVRIATVRVDSTTRKIKSYRLLNLKEFLCVSKTFESHLQAMLSSEKQSSKTWTDEQLSASDFLNHIEMIAENSPEPTVECCICLDRKPEVILPCTHMYCCPCIEQWNMSKKTCPICQEVLTDTNDSWVISELPEAHEVNEEICSELMKLSSNLDDKN